MIVIKEQSEIEVFSTDDGEIMIKQQSGMDDPAYVAIWPENVDALIAALLKEKNDIETGAPIHVASL